VGRGREFGGVLAGCWTEWLRRELRKYNKEE
jgi:hypothetical protein